MKVLKNYKCSIVDITDIVAYYEERAENLVETYFISANEVDSLFDYFVHKAVVYIVKDTISLDGMPVSSSYKDSDFYEDLFCNYIGEYMMASLHDKFRMYDILQEKNRATIAGSIVKASSKIKLVVLGNALWVFEGVDRKWI